MGFQWWQFLLIAVLVMLLFGRGKISGIMGDVADGIKSFKKGMREEEADTGTEATQSITSDNTAENQSNKHENSKAETKV